MNWYGFREYVSVAERSRRAEKGIATLVRDGLVLEPPAKLKSRMKIATSFWGRAWCLHLESYSDFENRLPRGRTYVRNGSVRHLSIAPGRIEALVMGSELYKEKIRIDPLPAEKWEAVRRKCTGRIGSLIELLQGKISEEIMAIVTDRDTGLFPSPKEIHLDCDCPDYADLCKHLAAVLYGVGAKLDTAPELLFKLRGVDHMELISAPEAVELSMGSGGTGGRRLAADSLESVFGIELDEDVPVEHDPDAARSARKPEQPAIAKDPAKTRPRKKAKPAIKTKKPSGKAGKKTVRKKRETKRTPQKPIRP